MRKQEREEQEDEEKELRQDSGMPRSRQIPEEAGRSRRKISGRRSLIGRMSFEQLGEVPEQSDEIDRRTIMGAVKRRAL